MSVQIKIHNISQSTPMIIDNVVNAYTKDGLYCLLIQKGEEKIVKKFPVCNIFSIEEPYNYDWSA